MRTQHLGLALLASRSVADPAAATAGDEVLIAGNEFPATVFPWLRLELRDRLDAIEAHDQALVERVGRPRLSSHLHNTADDIARGARGARGRLGRDVEDDLADPAGRDVALPPSRRPREQPEHGGVLPVD